MVGTLTGLSQCSPQNISTASISDVIKLLQEQEESLNLRIAVLLLPWCLQRAEWLYRTFQRVKKSSRSPWFFFSTRKREKIHCVHEQQLRTHLWTHCVLFFTCSEMPSFWNFLSSWNLPVLAWTCMITMIKWFVAK